MYISLKNFENALCGNLVTFILVRMLETIRLCLVLL